MDTRKYITRYTAPAKSTPEHAVELTSKLEQATTFEELYASSRAWSDVFSGLLYDKIAGRDQPNEKELRETFSQYADWQINVFPKIIDTYRSWVSDATLRGISSNHPYFKEATTQRQHAGFHDINLAFLPNWNILLGTAKPAPTLEDHNGIKTALSISGCTQAMNRRALMTSQGESAYFVKEVEEFRGTAEGLLHEVDAAIVLEDIAARSPRPLIVVPAPSMFEYEAGSRAGLSSANVDFIVIDNQAGECIGVQVKSQVHAEDLDEYDDSRVVLIDTKIDLGNQSVKQTKKGSSDKRVVGWAGLISVEQMNAIKLHSTEGRRITKGGFMKLKNFARIEGKGVNPQIRAAAQKIGPRILAKL